MNYQTAMRQLINKPYLATPKWREQQGRAARQGCHPEILEFEKAFISEMRRRGIPMFCHNMYRTGDEQDKLFKEGRSKLIGGQSAHNHGMAADIVHSTLAWGLDKRAWAIVGHIGFEVASRLKLDLEWGGDWDFYDPAHWQLGKWRQRLEAPHGTAVSGQAK